MANRFLSNIRINDAYTFPASDGNNGQAIITDGSGNLSFGDVLSDSEAASVIYRDNFTGDGTTVAFALQNSLSGEDQTFIYIDGVYQEKDTYSLSTNTITFTTAPASGDSVEVISISGVSIGPTVIYQDNFTGNGSTTDFTLAQFVDNEIKTMIYFNGVYQFKGTYSLNGDVITFATAPANGVEIEVITIASAAAEDFNQKLLFYGKANEAISKGDAVMFAGQEGDHFLFAKATQTAIAANHEYFIGLASQDLVTGEFGYVTEFGNVSAIDTSSYNAGDVLWFDAGGTTAGALTTTEPAAPLVKIQVAAVIRSHQNEGVIFVRPTWYHELGELHDVNLTSVADKDLLVWDNANGYWENTKALGDITATSLTVNGNTYVNSNSLQLTGATNPTILVTDTTNNVSVGLQALDGSTKIDSTNSFKIEIGNNIIQSVTSSGVEITGNFAVDTNTLYVDASNNRVGINMSSPSSILHLHGDTTSWASSPTIIMSSSSTANANIRNWRIGPADTNYGNFHIGVSDVQGGIVDSDSEGSTFTIDYQGKVGIGTKSPAAKLHVEIDTASETDVARFRTINGADNHFLDISVDNTNNLVAYDSSGASSGDHVFRTGGTERMRVTSSGQLQLPYGNASTLNGGQGVITDPGTFTGMKLYGSSDGNLKIFNVRNNASFGNILFYTGASVERFRIDNYGTLQITESSANGYINGNGTDLEIDVNRHPETGAFSDSSKGHARIALRAEDAGAGSRIIFSTASAANTPGTERMRIDSSGNVGIGTTSPAQKLEINGALRISGSPAIELTGSGTGTYNKTVIYNDLTYGFLVEATKHSDSESAAKKPITLTWRGGYSNNGGLNLTGNTKLYTTDTGLGINTTSPSYKLDVEGAVAFTDEILARSGTGSISNAGYVWQGKFTGNGVFIHLKTNLGWGANTQMYSWHFLGYAYGSAAPVDSMISFYNYPPSGSPINIGSSGTHSIILYQSSDGYIVVRIQFTNSYYTGLTMSARNTAQGVAWPSITATAQNGTSNHF